MDALEAFSMASDAVDDFLAANRITHTQLRDRVIHVVVHSLLAGIDHAATPSTVEAIAREQARWHANEIDVWLSARAPGIQAAIGQAAAERAVRS